MTEKTGRVLVVDDNPDVLKSVQLLLKRHVAVVQTEDSPSELEALLGRESFDVIILDMNFASGARDGDEGYYWLNRVLEVDPLAVVILMTAYGGISTAVRAIKEGATDFVLKPWQNEKLLATVNSAMSLRQSRRELAMLQSRQRDMAADTAKRFSHIIGDSWAMRRVFAMVAKAAPTDANVLILGENGTGKELIAREIHRQSGRCDEVIMTVDLGAIPEGLFESELFGHKKGAFTDAKEDRLGRFQAASGGTLFLDEIGNLPLSQQAKLLAALEQRQVVPVGSHKPAPIDVRLISATNMPLAQMVADGRFREDLMYRINTVEIRLPPLRERAEDVPALLRHFVDLYARKYKMPAKSIGAAALKRLQSYHWPGNIRELRHSVERALILSEGSTLEIDDFFLAPSAAPQSEDEGHGLVLDDLNLELVEQQVIRRALTRNAGNVSRAARELGLTRAALYRRMEKHGL